MHMGLFYHRRASIVVLTPYIPIQSNIKPSNRIRSIGFTLRISNIHTPLTAYIEKIMGFYVL